MFLSYISAIVQCVRLLDITYTTNSMPECIISSSYINYNTLAIPFRFISNILNMNVRAIQHV